MNRKLLYLFLIVMLSFSCQQKRMVNPEIEKLFSNNLEDYVEPLLRGFSNKMFSTSIGDSLSIERINNYNKVNQKPTIYNSNFRKITLYRNDTIITIDFWKSIDSYSLKTRTTLFSDSILKLEMYMFQEFSEINSDMFNKMKKKWEEDIIHENNKLNKTLKKILLSFPDFFRIDRFYSGLARKCPDRIRILILTLGNEAQWLTMLNAHLKCYAPTR